MVMVDFIHRPEGLAFAWNNVDLPREEFFDFFMAMKREMGMPAAHINRVAPGLWIIEQPTIDLYGRTQETVLEGAVRFFRHYFGDEEFPRDVDVSVTDVRC